MRQRIYFLASLLLLCFNAGCGGGVATATHAGATPSSAPAAAGPVVYLADMQLVRSAAVQQVAAVQGGKQLWVFTLPGASNALVVANGRVYVGTADTLFALDAASGHKVWSAPAGPRIISMMVVNGVVYVQSGGGGFAGQDVIYAFSAQDGTLRWRFNPSTLGVSAWLVDNGTLNALEVGFPPQLFALDAASGATLWQVSLQQASINGQVDALLATGSSLLVVADQSLLAVQQDTGAQVWRHDNTHNLGLQVFADTIYSYFVDRSAELSGGPDLVGLRALNVADGSVRWTQMLPINDGTYLGFQKNLAVGAITSTACYLIDGPSFGDVHAWALTGQPLWTVPSSDTYTLLAASNREIFLSSAQGITALDEASGKLVWRDSAPAEVSVLQVADDTLYGMNTEKNMLYAFEPGTGRLLWSVQANQMYQMVV